MEIIFITVPVTLVFIAVGVAIFFWASKGGQFDDLDGPAHRILFDEDQAPESKDSEEPKDNSAEQAPESKDTPSK
jgi:cbb3-type cytochrome oxidase maturation protein